MKDQLDDSFDTNNMVKKPKSGQGLDTAALVIGIIGVLWSCIPYAGAASLVITTTGVILGIVAWSRSKSRGDTRQGMSAAATLLNIIAIGISIFWICKIVTNVMENIPAIDEFGKSLQDTAEMRKSIEKAIEELAPTDSTAH
jgi:hypothetical protein